MKNVLFDCFLLCVFVSFSNQQDNCQCAAEADYQLDSLTSTLIVESPGYPNQYCADKQLICNWTVKYIGPSEGYVMVKITDHQLGDGDSIYLKAFDNVGKQVDVGNCNTEKCSYIAETNTQVMQSPSTNMMLDLGTQGRGKSGKFSSTFSVVQPKCVCNNRAIVLSTDGKVQHLTSPNFPYPYCKGLDCKWIIDSPSDYIVFLNSTFFHTVEILDKLSIFDRDETDSLIAMYSGSSDNFYPITSSETRMMITFNSKSVLFGFDLTLKAVLTSPITDCKCRDSYKKSLAKIDDVIQIRSPNFPNNYCAAVNCSWIISGSDDFQMKITFPSFRTESNSDFVKIIDQQTQDVVQTCSGVNCKSVKFPGTLLNISFNSNTNVQHYGFKALVTAVENICHCNSGTKTLNSIGSSIIISSPNYPYTYCNNLDCWWKVESPEYSIISLSFNDDFKIMQNDYIKVFDGGSAAESLLESCSGEKCDSVNSSDSLIYITFKSDSNGVTKPGFSVKVTAEKHNNCKSVNMINFANFFLIVVVSSFMLH